MKQRIITGIMMAVILLPVLYLGGWWMIGLTAILSYSATYELVRMHSKKHNLSNKYMYMIPIFSTILVLVSGCSFMGVWNVNLGDILFISILTCLLLLLLSVLCSDLKSTDAIFFIFAILYGGVSFVLATRARYLIFDDSSKYVGLALMGYLLVTTMFTDMGAYYVGVFFGKHKLCPMISPKKTIEGSIGGSIIGAICGTTTLMLCQHFLNFNLFNISSIFLSTIVIFGVSLLLTMMSQLGDLIASKMKREYDIKDFSQIFPGHGGVLDRFDSLIITGTTFYIILALLGVVL